MVAISRTPRRRSASGAQVAPDGQLLPCAGNRRGAILVLVGMLLVSMVGMLALAVDFGRLDSLKADLQTSADAAALAGAVELLRAASSIPAGDPRSVAAAWVAKNPAMHSAVSVESVLCGTYADAGPAFLPDYSPAVGCGGGAYNGLLMQQLGAELGPQIRVASTDILGVAPNHVEALAFAWLGQRFCARLAGNLPAVTGARGARILGALYPA